MTGLLILVGGVFFMLGAGIGLFLALFVLPRANERELERQSRPAEVVKEPEPEEPTPPEPDPEPTPDPRSVDFSPLDERVGVLRFGRSRVRTYHAADYEPADGRPWPGLACKSGELLEENQRFWAITAWDPGFPAEQYEIAVCLDHVAWLNFPRQEETDEP